MKTLKILQTLARIGRILSGIIYICSIVGAVGCTVGMLCLPLADAGIFKIGGVTIHGLLVNRAGIALDALYPLMAGAWIVCVGQAVTAGFSRSYFRHQLLAGTPFTRDGAGELLRLGILTICIPLGTFLLAQIVSAVIAEIIGCGEAFKLEGGDSVLLGAMMIVASLLCRHGAEVQEGLQAQRE